MTGKDDKDLPYNLENLSIPELEALLQQDFLTSGSGSPDVDYIMAIVEVIHKKEQANPDYHSLDTAKAWEEFKSFYSTEEGRANSIYRSDGEMEDKILHSKPEKQTSKHKKSKMFHRYLLIAASLCLLIAMTCVPVLGYHNIIQMLASWTAEQFGFYMPPTERSDPEQIPEEFEELQNIMQQLGAELIIPKFPEGFEVSDSRLSYLPDDGTLQFLIMYKREEEYYIFCVNWGSNNVIYQYEKDESLVEICSYNDINHYIMSNTNNNVVAWYIGNTEHYIISSSPISDLKKILEITYEVK